MQKAVFPEKKFYLFLFIIASLIYFVFIFRTAFPAGGEKYYTLVDDAMISMRYAKHLAQGNGLCWNIGEPPVQGYTNFSWTIYMAFLHFLPFPESKISLAVMLTGLLILLGNIFIVKRITEQVLPNSKAAPFLSSFLAAFYFPLIFWTLRGMEVGLVCLLINTAIFAALLLNSRFLWKSAFLFATVSLAALLTRTDTLLQLGILSVFVGTAAYRQRKINRFVIIGIVTMSIYSLYIIFISNYFGDLMPNTYYLKLLGVSLTERLSSGLKFFMREALTDTAFPILAIIGGMLLWGKELTNKSFILLLSLFLVQCIYSIYTGGDFAEDSVGGANRFVIQGMCPLFIIFSVTVMHGFYKCKNRIAIWNRRSLSIFLYMSFAVLFLVCGKHWMQWAKLNAPMMRYDKERTKLGLLVRKGTGKDARIAVHAAGQIPYYSERYTIDLLGKNDPVIAKGKTAAPFYPGHCKWNYKYSILERKPDIAADEWCGFGEWMEKNATGYKRLPNGIWVRMPCRNADISVLEKNYR